MYRSKNENVKSLWKDCTGRPIFKAVMPLHRFEKISRALRFDDQEERRAAMASSSRRERDRFAPIRFLFEKWVDNLHFLFTPYENITVDEQLISFRGRCPFRVYMPNKPGSKYGLKQWICADSRTKFICDVQPYLGKENPDAPPEKGQGERVVLDLVSKYRGRNVTCDNFFTTHSLASKLLKKNITLVGTVRKDKTFLPLCDQTKLKKRPVFSSQFYFDNKISLVQYIPRKGKCVTVMSTMHHDKSIAQGRKTPYASKDLPEMIEYYNQTKCGVDTADQLIRNYTCKRKTNRWPVAFFENMLDMSALNSYVLWLEVNPGWKEKKSYKRRLYLEELGEALVRPLLCQQNTQSNFAFTARIENDTSPSVSTSSTPISSRSSTPVSRSHTPEMPAIRTTTTSKRGRCSFCPSNIDRKTSHRCAECKKFICGTHQHTMHYCDSHVPKKNLK